MKPILLLRGACGPEREICVVSDYKPDIRAPARLRLGRASVFAYSLWVHCIDLFRTTAKSVEVPTRQWMSAAGRRLLTPAEFAARRKYFDRKIAKYRVRRAR